MKKLLTLNHSKAAAAGTKDAKIVENDENDESEEDEKEQFQKNALQKKLPLDYIEEQILAKFEIINKVMRDKKVTCSYRWGEVHTA